MKTEDYELSDNDVSFNLTSEGKDYKIKLPLDIEGRINPSQWYRNFSRKVKYAAEAAGKKISTKEAQQVAAEIVREEKVFDKIRATPSLWKHNDFSAWLKAEGLIIDPAAPEPEQPPAIPTPPDAREEGRKVNTVPSTDRNPAPAPSRPKREALSPQPPIKPIKEKMIENPVTQKNARTGVFRIAGIIAGVAVLAFGIYYLINYLNNGEPVLPADAEFQQELAEAKALLKNCVRLTDQPGTTLENHVGEIRYQDIRLRYDVFIDRIGINRDLGESKTVKEAAEKYIEEFKGNWEARCKCKLTYNCPDN